VNEWNSPSAAALARWQEGIHKYGHMTHGPIIPMTDRSDPISFHLSLPLSLAAS
jgi:hypothetical protein